MTPEQIRILIAEHEGWKLCDEEIVKPDGTVIDCEFLTEEAVDQSWPNWPNNLNAVHEVEEALAVDEDLWKQYVVFLGGICYESLTPHLRTAWHDSEQFADWVFCRATALQRCEALLRTWGLWREEPCKK